MVIFSLHHMHDMLVLSLYFLCAGLCRVLPSVGTFVSHTVDRVCSLIFLKLWIECVNPSFGLYDDFRSFSCIKEYGHKVHGIALENN